MIEWSFHTLRHRMRTARWLVFLLITGALLVTALPLAAAPVGGTLTGKVVMKTAGASLPNTPLTVTLLYINTGLFRDEATPESRTTTTAPDGSFSFSGLDPSAAGVYRVIVQYKGVAYEPAEHDVTADTSMTGGTGKSRAVRFPANATTVSTEIPVYEPVVSDTPANLTVKADQIIINEVRPQFYSVLEVVQVANSGDRTLVAALNPDGSAAQGVPVTFTVPADAQSVGTNRVDLLPGADLSGQKLTLRLPVQPGPNDVEAIYNLPGSSNGLMYQRTLDYAMPKVQVLVSDSHQAIFSSTLKDDGPIQAPQGATGFRQFSLDNGQAGQTISLTIGPSPPAPARTAPATPQKSAFTQWRERLTVPVLLGLALVCLALMVLILRTPVREPAAAGVAPRRGSRARAATAGRSEPDKDAADDKERAVERKETQAARVGARERRVRGRPPDYDLDEAERAIEEANEEAESE